MISIVICHTNDLSLNNVSENVASTIGVPYEIIAIDNKQNKHSLCSAYNEGAGRSKYDILCFMHEDILFHTNDWGKLVAGYLSDKTIGVIGLCGGKYRSSIPGGWWAVEADYNRQCTIQHPVDTPGPKLVYQNPNNEIVSDVVVLDGLWMCCGKEIWKKIGFDEKVFKGFHFYDMDFSLQAFIEGYRVCVVYNINIEHLSNGSYDRDWLDNAIKFGKKWESALPVASINLTPRQIRRLEYAECCHFMNTLIRFNFKRNTILEYFLKCLKFNFLNSKNHHFGIYMMRLYLPGLWEFFRKLRFHN